jgi:Tfp pilus assembly protein PilO
VIALAVAACVVLTGIWYFALFSPQSRSIKKANNQAAASNGQAATLRSEIGVLQQEKTQLPAAQAKLTTLKLALPDTPALDKMIDDINNAAAQAGVDWQTLSPAKPSIFVAGTAQAAAAGGLPGGMQAVTVGMQVTGSYHQVTDFITKLTGLSRLLDVETVNLSGVGGTAKSIAQLSTQIFFVPPGAAAPATTTTVTP